MNHSRVDTERRRVLAKWQEEGKAQLQKDNEVWREQEMGKALYERLTNLDPEELKPAEKEWIQRWQNDHLTRTLRPQVETEIHGGLLTQFMPLYDELPEEKRRELTPGPYAQQHGPNAWYKAVYEASIDHRNTTAKNEWSKEEQKRIQAAIEADRAARRATERAPDISGGNGTAGSMTLDGYLRLTPRERAEWDKNHTSEEKKAMEATAWR